MPRNVYSEINLHLAWHTKDDAPLLVERIESRVHHFLKDRAIRTPGVYMHAVNGTETHVHLAVSVPPTLLISDWIGELKGSSSHHVNHAVAGRKVLAWQTGHGVVSFGTRDLTWVVDYIRRQKEHHASGRVFDRLERTEELKEGVWLPEPEGEERSPLKRASEIGAAMSGNRPPSDQP